MKTKQNIEDYFGLNWQVAKHHAVIHSFPPFAVGWWRESKRKKEKKFNSYDKYVYVYIYTTNNAQAIAYYLLTDVQIAHEQWQEAWWTSIFFKLSFHVMSYGMEYPFVQFRSDVLILSPHISLGSPRPSLAGEYKKLKK